MAAIGLRAWIQFGDVHPKMGSALTLLTATLVINMLTFFHSSIGRYHFGLPGLLVRFVILYLKSFGIIGVLSLASAFACTVLAYQTLREQVQEHGGMPHPAPSPCPCCLPVDSRHAWLLTT